MIRALAHAPLLGNLRELRADPLALFTRLRAECGDLGAFHVGPRRLVVLVALFGLGHVWGLAETVGFEPLAILPFWVGILALLELRRSATAPEAGVPGLASPRFDSTSTA